MTCHDPNEVLLRRLSLLWSRDDDEDHEQPSDTGLTIETQYSTPRAPNLTTVSQRAVEVVDLVSPEVSLEGLKQATYVPRTLCYQHQQRLLILPLFPRHERSLSAEPALLLASVPTARLSIQQAVCRRAGEYPPMFSLLMASSGDDSFMKEKYDYFFGYLSERMKVDMRILDYNYVRLKHMLRLFAESRIRILSVSRSTMPQWLVKEEEYPALLEFYLQMDVDLFFKKTCSFRDAQPRSEREGLFCSELPECRYTMTACGLYDLCRPSSVIVIREQPSVQFNRYELHRFVNGYESILNDPANCSTTNIIYVLTCPCGKYDYIGESSQTLVQCLRRHRQFGHRFLHEFLIGEKNRQRAREIQQKSEMAAKSRMHLYQHSIRCSTAVQLFLDCNPQYWCFVPMLEADASLQNQYTATNSAKNANRSIEERLSYVPMPTEGYQFARRQLVRQYEYFVKHLDGQPPHPDLNLYQAKIIALLLLEASELFRQVIHALFVTHTEAKLNTIGRLFDSNTQTYIHNGVWCENLIRPRRSTTATTPFRC